MKFHVFPTGFEVHFYFKRKYIHHAEQLFPRRVSDFYITMEAFQPAETVTRMQWRQQAKHTRARPANLRFRMLCLGAY